MDARKQELALGRAQVTSKRKSPSRHSGAPFPACSARVAAVCGHSRGRAPQPHEIPPDPQTEQIKSFLVRVGANK